MITYKKLVEKFLDKGYEQEIHWLLVAPIPFIPGKIIAESMEEEEKIYNKIIQEVYEKEWDYWNTWIDHQNHRFNDCTKYTYYSK